MINFDAFTDGGAVAPGSSPLTWSHTCTGSNRALLVAVSIGAAAGTITGATYNSVAMSKLITTDFNGSLGVLEMWGLVNPASGANNISVTWTGSQFMGASAVSYTGVAQYGLPDASAYTDIAGVSSSSISTSVTTVADRTWLVAATYANTTNPTAGTNQTARGTTATRGVLLGDTNAVQTPAGSFSIASNISPNKVDLLQTIVSLADVSQPGGAFFLYNFIR